MNKYITHILNKQIFSSQHVIYPDIGKALEKEVIYTLECHHSYKYNVISTK